MRKLEADGDTWQVTSDGYDEAPGVRTFVFHCLSDTQRPYRVVQVPEPMLRDRTLDGVDDTELREFFERSHTMDFSHDRAANPESHGYGDPPLA
jgi:hypothetical protein